MFYQVQGSVITEVFVFGITEKDAGLKGHYPHAFQSVSRCWVGQGWGWGGGISHCTSDSVESVALLRNSACRSEHVELTPSSSFTEAISLSRRVFKDTATPPRSSSSLFEEPRRAPRLFRGGRYPRPSPGCRTGS